MTSKPHSLNVHTFKPTPTPAGTCQRTIIDAGKARICGIKCEGQLCPSCKERAAEVAIQFRGAGRAAGNLITGY